MALVIFPLAVAAITYKCYSQIGNINKSLRAEPIILTRTEDCFKFDMAPIHPDWRRVYVSGLTSGVSVDGTMVEMRSFGPPKTTCVEVNQHFYWI